MKIYAAVYSTENIVPLIPLVLEQLKPIFPSTAAKFLVFRRMDTWEPFDYIRISNELANNANDDLELKVPKIGRLLFSWCHGPNRGWQIVNLEVNVTCRDTFKSCFRSVIDTLHARYALADRLTVIPLLECELQSKGRASYPTECLKDLFWYNVFGPELVDLLWNKSKIDFLVSGLVSSVRRHGIEVEVEAGPCKRPYPVQIESYLRDTHVFLRLDSKARFKTRVPFDFSALESKLP